MRGYGSEGISLNLNTLWTVGESSTRRITLTLTLTLTLSLTLTLALTLTLTLTLALRAPGSS